jgi:hypothetical protein
VKRVGALIAICMIVTAGCGSSAKHSPKRMSDGAAGTSTIPTAGAIAAEHPNAAQFPVAEGKTLQELAGLAQAQTQFVPATVTFTPADHRVAFGIITSRERFLYAPTAIYIARGPKSPADGPFIAPADPMTVAPQYRSNEDDGPEGLQAIYAANVHLPGAGHYTVLALTRTARGLAGGIGRIFVARSSPIPDVGQRPPAIATDTLSSVGGNTQLLTTRVPPEDMHSVSFKDVLGRRPIALLFSTPQLCQSRVCGPVTDAAVQLQHEFGSRVTFIHEEVYVNNQPDRGLRRQLKAFHIRSEPWLFTINCNGVIAARLEGAFGTTELRRALEAAFGNDPTGDR